jgi:hypothetical protein
MFNIKLSDNSTYAEEGQKNPLRWKTLYKEADGSFTDQSGWIKCKDFYNDSVAYFKEKSVFSIYAYKNDIKKNDTGVYFLLKFVQDKKSFLHNLNVVNTRLHADLKCEVGYWDLPAADEMLIHIPNELWETTYRISMITMVVRLCNYGNEYGTWESIWDTHAPVYKVEHSFTQQAKDNAQKMGFLVPDKFKDYWFYCGPKYNSKVAPKTTGGTIHNNGVSNWSMFMKDNNA